MTVTKEYWNIPKPDDVLSVAQGTNLTVFVDHADNALIWGLGASDVTAIAGVVIAIIAASISIWQGYINRRHNQMSVKPILNMVIIPHGGDKGDDTQTKYFTFTISNNGIGPAMVTDAYLTINKIKIYEKNKTYTTSKTNDNRKLIAEALGLEIDSDIKVAVMSEEFCMKEGQVLEILYVKIKGIDHVALHEAINKIEFSLKYTDIYGVEQPTIYLEPKA